MALDKISGDGTALTRHRMSFLLDFPSRHNRKKKKRGSTDWKGGRENIHPTPFIYRYIPTKPHMWMTETLEIDIRFCVGMSVVNI